MASKNRWIVMFDECSREDVPLVGGKCANLGEMCKMGLPVPPGFAITTEAYDKFLEVTGIGIKMKQYLDKVGHSPNDLQQFNEIGNTLAGYILGGEIPQELKEAISKAYNTLCERIGVENLSVAVRSSGIAEDMRTASFAGQYDSYLNVIGVQHLFESVLQCWASAFTPRCISYRIHIGLGVLAGSISVGVQKMVKSRSAGVGFTANPNTGEKDRIVIEGNWGAGESIVQGITKVDIFSIDKDGLKIVDEQINEKTIQTVFVEKGVIEREVPENKRLLPCLSHEEIETLARLIRDAEVHYGVPLDTEWAVDSDLEFPNNIFLVQARPITAIAEEKSATEKILDMACKRLFPV